MKNRILHALSVAVLLLPIFTTKAEDATKPKVEEAKAAPQPARSAVQYRVPESCIVYAVDQEESLRRYRLNNEMSNADVFSKTNKTLIPIVKNSPFFPSVVGEVKPGELRMQVKVTPEEDKQLREALAKGELFVIYYHYGW